MHMRLISNKFCGGGQPILIKVFLVFHRILVEACRGSSSRGYSGGPRQTRGRDKYVVRSWLTGGRGATCPGPAISLSGPGSYSQFTGTKVFVRISSSFAYNQIFVLLYISNLS